ncbi:hypothetical protein EMEDMD4_910026 [Sinorhizobium medicae]|uniref:Uncharacterized protein n=1 Tax=Sinorhizobium medicae TaxID=110321 RepID=A0A508XBY4_9HYPH|nr:hypothetical protein EMEDMD4_910026 [Sinorhizobium medicae]
MPGSGLRAWTWVNSSSVVWAAWCGVRKWAAAIDPTPPSGALSAILGVLLAPFRGRSLVVLAADNKSTAPLLTAELQ